uniref:Uncharacterized protein n=1 Tax=Anguilla anguilla TaxID=7936 RepID=A0A0E9TWY6_ANGAN
MHTQRIRFQIKTSLIEHDLLLYSNFAITYVNKVQFSSPICQY